MTPACVPFGTTSRQRPGRGSRTAARQLFGATRLSVISKPSRGMFACARDESPVTVPTTSYQSLPGATAISRSQSFPGTTQPVSTSTTNDWPTAGVRSATLTASRPFAEAAGTAIAAAQSAMTKALTFLLRSKAPPGSAVPTEVRKLKLAVVWNAADGRGRLRSLRLESISLVGPAGELHEQDAAASSASSAPSRPPAGSLVSPSTSTGFVRADVQLTSDELGET